MSNESEFAVLLHDDTEEFKKIIPKVVKLVKIKSDGTPVLVADKSKLTNAEQILCYYIGKFYSFLMNKTSSEAATNEEIASFLRIQPKLVNPRVSELYADRKIEKVSRGSYKISTVNLDKLVEELISKLERVEKKT